MLSTRAKETNEYCLRIYITQTFSNFYSMNIKRRSSRVSMKLSLPIRNRNNPVELPRQMEKFLKKKLFPYC